MSPSAGCDLDTPKSKVRDVSVLIIFQRFPGCLRSCWTCDQEAWNVANAQIELQLAQVGRFRYFYLDPQSM